MHFFSTNAFRCSKYFLTPLESFGQRVLNGNFRDFSLFNVEFKRQNCPSTRCISAANSIDSDTDVFDGRSVSAILID